MQEYLPLIPVGRGGGGGGGVSTSAGLTLFHHCHWLSGLGMPGAARTTPLWRNCKTAMDRAGLGRTEEELKLD